MESRSIIKEEKKSRNKKVDSKMKDKSKSKHKSKSRTVDKKSKEKQKYYFVKVSTSKSKKKHLEDELTHLPKKVTPRKNREHPFLKEITDSEIVHKPRKRSILNQKVPSTKKLLG